MQPDLSQFYKTDIEGMLVKAKGFWDNPELLDTDLGLCYNLTTEGGEMVYSGYNLVEGLGLSGRIEIQQNHCATPYLNLRT